MIVFGIFLFGFIVRILWLDADPSLFLSYGSVGDEGLWVHNARLKTLFDERTIDQFSHDYAVAPLFSWIIEFSFRLFGVHFWSARLPSAISGFFLVLVGFDILRRILPKNQKAMAAALLAVYTPLLVHSRLAVAESVAMLFITGAWWLWLVGSQKWHYVGAGVALGLSILAKSTTIQYLPVFVLLALVAYFVTKDKEKGICAAFGFMCIAMFAGWYWWMQRESVLHIFSTFARVYSWSNAASVSSVFVSLIFHPFWGSPFIIGFVWLGMLNGGSFVRLLITQRAEFFRKVHPVISTSFLWLLGGLPLVLFGTNHPSTRFYLLIVPIIILALSKPQHTNRPLSERVKHLLVVCILFVIAVGLTKGVLAIARRTIITDDMRELLYWPTVALWLTGLLLLSICLPRVRIWMKAHLGTAGQLIIGLVLTSTLVQWILDWWKLSEPVPFTISLIKLFAVLILGFGIWIVRRRLTVSVVLRAHFIVSVIGLSLIFGNMSYSIRDSARKLGELTSPHEYTVGFLTHELSLENQIYPIYWGPRQPFVGTFNETYARTLPTVILVPEYLEAHVPTINSWPGLHDYPNRSPIRIGTLTWNRRWLHFERTVHIGVYRFTN